MIGGHTFHWGHMDCGYAHLEWFGSSEDKKYVIYLNYTVKVDGQNVMLTIAGIPCGGNRAVAVRRFRELRKLLKEETEEDSKTLFCPTCKTPIADHHIQPIVITSEAFAEPWKMKQLYCTTCGHWSYVPREGEIEN